MKRFLLLFILGFSLAFSSQAQSLSPSVLGSAGEHVQAGGMQVSFTVGEAGGVTTATSGGIILTQGFQQVDPVGSTGGSGNKPTIYVTANLSTFTTTVGTPSSNQSFSISGTNLTGNISLSAPSSFEISLASGSGYGSSLNLTPISGSVATTVIYVRYNPSASGQHSGNISCTSSGASSQSVAVSGTTGNPSPVIITSVSALNAFTTTVGTPSSSVGFTVSGNDLVSNLIVSAPSQFEVSLSSGSGFGSSVSFSPSNGKVNNQTVYVRYNPSAAGSHNGNVTCTSTSATTQNVAVSGNSTGSPIPTIVTSVSSLSAFSTTVGTASSVQNFTVSGSDLSSNLVVTAPSQFEVSLNSNSGFGSSVSFSPNSGVVSNGTVYVRYNPSASGSHNGNIACTSTGATTKNVAVTGNASVNNTPNITISVNSLNAFSTYLGIPSSTQNFSVSGTNLTANLIVSAPTHFEVSLNTTSGFGSSVSLSPSSGTVGSTNIYVRYNPSVAGNHNGDLICSSSGANSKGINISGSATVNTNPTITASVSSLTAFSTSVGTTSSEQSFKVSGVNLNFDIVVTAPNEFEVSLSSGSGFSSFVVLNENQGTVNSTTVYVRYNPFVSGPHSGNITCVSLGATTQNVLVNGTTSGTITPVITTSVSLLNPFTTQVGTPSTAQLYTVIGSDLTGLLLVSAPADFQVSLSSTTGFGGSVYFNPVGGKVNNGTVYVRYNPTTAGNHIGDIDNVSSGATTVSVSLSGTATLPAGPVVTATNISNSFVTTLGTPSAAQAMAVNGSNLLGDITVSSPTNFEVSLSPSSGFNNSLLLSPSGGSVSTKIIYVRYNPSSAGTHNGSVIVSSQGANTQTVAVDGTSYVGIGSVSSIVKVFELYPNPTREKLQVLYSLNKYSPMQIHIYDMQGKLLFNQNNNNASLGNNVETIDVSNFAKGIYILQLNTNEGTISSKFIVE